MLIRSQKLCRVIVVLLGFFYVDMHASSVSKEQVALECIFDNNLRRLEIHKEERNARADIINQVGQNKIKVEGLEGLIFGERNARADLINQEWQNKIDIEDLEGLIVEERHDRKKLYDKRLGFVRYASGIEEREKRILHTVYEHQEVRRKRALVKRLVFTGCWVGVTSLFYVYSQALFDANVF